MRSKFIILFLFLFILNLRSTKAEVRFNVNEATWIPEEIKIHFIKITSNKQNSEGYFRKFFFFSTFDAIGEYITSSDHSRTQELNLSNCLNQIRQLLEDAYRLANGGVTKKQLKMDKIKRNNDRNRRRRAKKEALIATLLNSKSMPTKDLSANSMEATGNVRIKLNSKDPLPKTTTTKLPIMQSIPTESTQFSPLTRNKHETFE